MNELAAVQVIISGRVQGVFFRAETRKAAETRHLSGYVRNMPDRTVEALFQGRRPDIDDMLDWCRKGSPLSDVDRVTTRKIVPSQDLTGFEILY